MKITKGKKASVSRYLMYGALLSVVLAAIGWVGPDIWLASTQWLIMALVLIAFSMYLKLA